jgi:DNA helicase-2/ATP-dependent DNA helicase PcrA
MSSLAVEQASKHEGFAAAKSSAPAMRIGQSVRHDRFGDGVVVSLEGRGADARAQINFGRQGLKWLALSVAKLQLL